MKFTDFLYRQKQKWKYHTAATPFEKNAAEINRNEPIVTFDDRIFTIKGCTLRFSRQDHAFIIDGIELFLALLKAGDFVITGKDVLYKIDGLNLTVTTAEEIFIIHEVFLEGCYAVSAKGEFNVVDIGMNVGYASLFFARRDNIKKVYGFEPFLPTYRQAEINFQNNRSTAAKIESFAHGIGGKVETLQVNYTYDSKAQVGIYGTELIKGAIHGSDKIDITLLSAHEELQRIFAAHRDERFILKVDCEGAEYGIFRNLDQHKMLDHIDIIFIEWHEEGPEVLLDILLRNNFKSFYQQSSSKKVGMIYAAK